ncbi:axonemal dynein light chain domain-containing protein 1 isoform X2 [Ambystoma mexicanum]|uniref:axonemal dynein light chain domain-containing protein 1 isoform X2 n=1 Tax=Ambystoma mexicanum TaxID=8296 RepID=UPI0037E90E58
MSLHEVPMPPNVPKPEGRTMKGGMSVMLVGEENAVLPSLKEKSSALDRSHPLPTSLQSDFIPEEILSVLTSTVNAATRPDILGPPKKNKSLKDMKAGEQIGLRNTDPVWHHPGRRGRFKHLTEQPVCLTGAGRDISFLCDAVMVTEKSTGDPIYGGTRQNEEPGIVGITQKSLIPQEFHIVKNRGVLGLEYYEDKYTTLLEDPEKRLMLFPSMKPNSRAEVLQLMKVMDAMLEKAGVNSEDIGTAGPTQMHNLLELVKAEQNIYNIVFHELIRQVSVECVERGALLSSIRQRYVNLLDRIPRQVQSIHNDMMAQRAVDRRLTEEVVHFKNCIGDLISDLCQVRERDLRVSKEANYAREELAVLLDDSKRNSNMLDEYRELYEMQRLRLEAQIEHLTEERDLWSSVTYRLAQKDTLNISQIQQMIENWRELMVRFGQEVERAEESSREKLLLLHGDLEKWHTYFKEKVFVNSRFQGVPDFLIENLLQDLKNWAKMMSEDLDRFGGDVLLSGQDRLKLAGEIQQQWAQLGQEVLQRHRSLDGDFPPEHKVMEELNCSAQQLCVQYKCRVEGENGVARLLMKCVSSVETWTYQLQAIWCGPHRMPESEWLKLYLMLPEWMDQVDKTLKLIGTTQSEEAAREGEPHKHIVPGDLFKMLQQWITALASGAEKDDMHLTQEVTQLHTSMVRWMVNLLIFLAPNYPSSDAVIPTVTAEFPDEGMPTQGASMQELEKDARSLTQKLNRFSSYIISSCRDMVGKIAQDKGDAIDADPNYELRELETVKTECNEWIETCKLLLLDIGGQPVPFVINENESRMESTEVPQGGMVITRSSLPLVSHGPLPQDPVRDQLEKLQRMDVIGHDANIKKINLKGDEILVSKEGMMTAARPQTPKSHLAFETLATLEQLHEQLLQTELRAQKAEEAAEHLDEQLRNALERVQELERQTPAESKTVLPKMVPEGKTLVEEPERNEPLNNQPPTPPRQRKRIKSGKGKH